jgi:hypothetical protein
MVVPSDANGRIGRPAPVKLTVTVIGGHKLPNLGENIHHQDRSIDPYVCLSLSGSLADSSPSHKYHGNHHHHHLHHHHHHPHGYHQENAKTKIVHDNDLNPFWGETFEFHLLLPDLATLLFVVRDHLVIGHDMMQPDLIGQYALPVASIRQGFRAMPLKNKGGETHPFGACLFIQVAVEPLLA